MSSAPSASTTLPPKESDCTTQVPQAAQVPQAGPGGQSAVEVAPVVVTEPIQVSDPGVPAHTSPPSEEPTQPSQPTSNLAPPQTPPTSHLEPVEGGVDIIDLAQNLNEITPQVDFHLDLGQHAHILVRKPTDNHSGEVNEVLLKVIGTVWENQCFLGGEGNLAAKRTWQTNGKKEGLAFAKLTFVVKSSSSVLTQGGNPFTKYTSNLSALMKRFSGNVRTEGILVPLGLPGRAKEMGLRMSWDLFRKRNPDDEEDTGPRRITSWPIPAQYRSKLEEIESTHDVCPLRAYDSNNQTIQPEDYEEKLTGATVEVSFALKVWHFQAQKDKPEKTQWLADLREVCVIAGPPPAVGSPLKRRNIEDGPSQKRQNISP